MADMDRVPMRLSQWWLTLDSEARKVHSWLVLIAMGFAIAMIDPPMIMMGIALVYAASGPAKSLWQKLRGTSSP